MKLIDKTAIQLTEPESILFAIGMGLSNGSEFDTKAWKERGCFKSGDGTHKRHITNLECCAEEVFFEGKGKKRFYTLRNFFLIPKDRQDRRVSNGYKHSDDELILDEYVFNFLLRGNYRQALPHKSWSYRIGFFPMELLKQKSIIDEMKKTLDKLHHKTIQYSTYDQKKFIDIFIETVKARGVDVIDKAFSRLEQAGRIVVENGYIVKTIGNIYSEITLKEYEQLVIEENIILEENGLNRQEYIYKKINKHLRDKNYYDVSKKITSYMKEYHEIQYYYIAKLPIVLDKDKQKSSEVDGMTSYYNRFFALTESRQKSYANSYDNWKVWYLVNMYSLLEIFGVSVPKEKYGEELKRLEKSYVYAFDFKEQIKIDVEDNLPSDF